MKWTTLWATYFITVDELQWNIKTSCQKDEKKSNYFMLPVIKITGYEDDIMEGRMFISKPTLSLEIKSSRYPLHI